MHAVSEEIKFKNRYDGSIRTEKVYGEKWLNLIYGNPLGTIPLWFAIKRTWFSRWYGRKMSLPESKSKIGSFIREYELDESEFLASANSYQSFNQFFSRKLNREARPINEDSESITFPADGRHMGFDNLSTSSSIFIKGQSFDLAALFESTEMAKKYENGSLVISRLCPVDYHRFHFPSSGMASANNLINGFLYSVNPIALRKNISIFWQNKRYLSFVENDNTGMVAIFLVGATCVGSVSITAQLPGQVDKGEELGYFSFGGSCVLTLFEEGKVSLSADLVDCSAKGIELYARMGDTMGTIK